jgi:hypothetical protein
VSKTRKAATSEPTKQPDVPMIGYSSQAAKPSTKNDEDVTMKRKPQGRLRPLEFAEGFGLARPADRERLIADMRAAGAKVYRIAGRKFVDDANWQATLQKLAVEVSP